MDQFVRLDHLLIRFARLDLLADHLARADRLLRLEHGGSVYGFESRRYVNLRGGSAWRFILSVWSIRRLVLRV